MLRTFSKQVISRKNALWFILSHFPAPWGHLVKYKPFSDQICCHVPYVAIGLAIKAHGLCTEATALVAAVTTLTLEI